MIVFRANYEFKNNGYISVNSTPWFTTKELVRQYLDKKGITEPFTQYSCYGPRLEKMNILEECPEKVYTLQEDREFDNEITRIHREAMRHY